MTIPPNVRVILIRPRYKGNLGFAARAMANFGIRDLVLVGPRGDKDSAEARERAAHAVDILEGARVVETLDEALSSVELAIGATARARPSKGTLTPAELAHRLVGGMVYGLVIGPEESGLSEADLARMDLIVRIPCSEDYPSMNLSHAVAILLYEMTRTTHEKPFAAARAVTRERLLAEFESLIGATALKNPRVVRAAFKALLSRSPITEGEASALMALAREARRAATAAGPGRGV
jgi:TrmH family RNA methyltransferase